MLNFIIKIKEFIQPDKKDYLKMIRLTNIYNFFIIILLISPIFILLNSSFTILLIMKRQYIKTIMM